MKENDIKLKWFINNDYRNLIEQLFNKVDVPYDIMSGPPGFFRVKTKNELNYRVLMSVWNVFYKNNNNVKKTNAELKKRPYFNSGEFSYGVWKKLDLKPHLKVKEVKK